MTRSEGRTVIAVEPAPPHWLCTCCGIQGTEQICVGNTGGTQLVTLCDEHFTEFCTTVQAHELARILEAT